MKNIFKITFITFLLTSLLSSCSFGSDKEIEEKIKPTDSLSTFLGMPAYMRLYSDKLFVMDVFSENGYIRVIDTNSGKEDFSFARKGNGPNEYIYIDNIDFFKDRGTTKVGLFDPTSKTYHTYSYDSLMQNKENIKAEETRKIDINLNLNINQLTRTDSFYLGVGFIENGKYALFDDSLKSAKIMGKYRPKKGKSIPDHIHAKANHGRIFMSSDFKRIGNIVYAANAIDVSEIKNGTIIPKWDYVINELDYTIQNNNSKNNLVEGYVAGCFSERYVYALYCGEKYNPNDNATYASHLHIFDDSGRLVKKYDLNRRVLDICIDKDKMYLLSHEPEPSILIYKLDKQAIEL